jgi:hypothetical protein
MPEPGTFTSYQRQERTPDVSQKQKGRSVRAGGSQTFRPSQAMGGMSIRTLSVSAKAVQPIEF